MSFFTVGEARQINFNNAAVNTSCNNKEIEPQLSAIVDNVSSSQRLSIDGVFESCDLQFLDVFVSFF
jgi:hypothetical protein